MSVFAALPFGTVTTSSPATDSYFAISDGSVLISAITASITESVSLTDMLGVIFNVSIAENVIPSDSLVPIKTVSTSISEQVNPIDSTTRGSFLTAELTEALQLTDSENVTVIDRGSVIDIYIASSNAAVVASLKSQNVKAQIVSIAQNIVANTNLKPH